MMRIQTNFTTFLAVSIIVHLTFLVLFRMKFPIPQLQEEFIEVELISQTDTGEPGVETKTVEEQVAAVREAQNSQTVNEGEQPDLLVEQQEEKKTETNSLVPLLEKPQGELPLSSIRPSSSRRTGSKNFNFSSPEGTAVKEIPLTADNQADQQEKILRRRGTKSVYKVVDPSVLEKKEQNDYIYNMEMEGEAARRKVIFKPKIPSVNIDRIVTISFRFTVLPNGEVDQIFPLLKGEPELEKIAMQTLRKYRFEPLPADQPTQSGIIRFILKKEIGK